MRYPSHRESTLFALGLSLSLIAVLSTALGISAPQTFSLLRLIVLTLGIALIAGAIAMWLQRTHTPANRKELIKNSYKSLAYLFFNSIILFVGINVLIGLVLPIIQIHQEESNRAWVLYRDYFPSTYPHYEAQEVETLLRESWNLALICDPFTHFREAPFEGKYVNVSSDGFREIANQSAWPPVLDEYVIFFFGGSTTFGYGVADSETIPSQVQEQLRAKGLDASVYNFGRASYFSTQELILFQNLLRDGYHPDAVVFIDGLNDFQRISGNPKGLTVCANSIEWNRSPGAITVDLPMLLLAQQLSTASNSRESNEDAVDLALETQADDEINAGIIERWFANIEMGRSIAGQYNIQILNVWQPVPTYQHDPAYYPYLTPDSIHYEWLTRLPYGYEMLAKMKQDSDLTANILLDLSDMQVDRHEMLYVDRVHYTAAFSSDIAARISEALLEVITQP